MEIIMGFVDFFLHLDKHMGNIIHDYGMWTYLILFLIIFCETGLVVTPFLPGDSLIFAAGAFAAIGALDAFWLYILLMVAAILGNMCNYTIGHIIGPRVFHFESSFFFKKEYLEKTHKFFEKYGGITVIITRFMPILRTFAPFVAGVGYMSYLRFTIYNLIGGIAWVSIFLWVGYFFGNMPFIKKNFSIIILAIILVSVLPAVVAFIREKFKKEPA
jgi:membrane-associated protein